MTSEMNPAQVRDFETERTPLLSNQHVPPQPSASVDPIEDIRKISQITPLPKLQVALVCILRLAEPIAFMAIVPFIMAQLLYVGAAESEEGVGYAAGLVEALFSITQLPTVLFWGWLSDRIGRKPVLIIGALGSGITGIMYGTSSTYWEVIMWRCLSGAMNGNVVVLKCVMGELSDETNQSIGFSLFPMMLNLGGILAAFIGGNYAKPAESHPRIVEWFPVFRTYPYLLPSLLAGSVPIIAGILTLFLLKETLPPQPIRKTEQDSDRDSQITANDDIPPADFKYSDLCTWRIFTIMLSFGMFTLIGSSMGGLLPVYYFTSIRLGGVGFTSKDIGHAMMIRSITTFFCQLVVFPPVQRRMNTTKLFKVLLFFWIPQVWGLPLLNILGRRGSRAGQWSVLIATMVAGSIGNMANVCHFIMVNDAAPSPYALGAINGVSQSVVCLMRIFGPGGASVLFALSITKHVLGGWMVWLVVGSIAVLTFLSGLLIPVS